MMFNEIMLATWIRYSNQQNHNHNQFKILKTYVTFSQLMALLHKVLGCCQHSDDHDNLMCIWYSKTDYDSASLHILKSKLW